MGVESVNVEKGESVPFCRMCVSVCVCVCVGGVFTESRLSDSGFICLPGCPPPTFYSLNLLIILSFLCHWLKLKLFLSCNLKKLEKEKQIESKVNKRMETITVRTEINKTGYKNQ